MAAIASFPAREVVIGTLGTIYNLGPEVDEETVRQIAAEMGEPVELLLARTTRWMIEGGSRHLAKLFVFARMSKQPELIDEVEARMSERLELYERSRPLRIEPERP